MTRITASKHLVLLHLLAVCSWIGCRHAPFSPAQNSEETLACSTPREPFPASLASALLSVEHSETTIEDANVCQPLSDIEELAGLGPRQLDVAEAPEYWNLSLEEVVSIGLANGEVMRELGIRVLDDPPQLKTKWDPAIAESSPQLGTAAALSAFDAQFSHGLLFKSLDREINNTVQDGGVRFLQGQDVVAKSELSKRAATGTLFSLRSDTFYTSNNRAFNTFPSAYETIFEAGFNHPMLQGGGVAFNRIAGPNSVPGVYRGVLISRVRTDIEIAEFEAALNKYLLDLETTYWELSFAHQDLETKLVGLDTALENWRAIESKRELGARGGQAEAESRARQLYFEYLSQVDAARSGVANHEHSGRFTGGVFLQERKLRSLMGLTSNDGRLIKPTDVPTTAKVGFDWPYALSESLSERPELRKRRWELKKRQLEYLASKNFVLPRVDLVGAYWRQGLDPHLDDAWGELFDGDFQEARIGIEFASSIGRRQGHAAVRHAQLRLAREQAILREQEREVASHLSESFTEVERSFRDILHSYNHKEASQEYLDNIRRRYDAGTVPYDDLAKAERLDAESTSRHHRSIVDYNIALAVFNYHRGVIQRYNRVHLAESDWPEKARQDAERNAGRLKITGLDYRMEPKAPLSR